MKPVALALLAGLLAVALFQFVFWQDDGDLEGILDQPDGSVAEAPGDRVGSGLQEVPSNLTASVDTLARKEIGTAKIRVTGQLIGPKGAAVVGTEMHLHLDTMVSNPYGGFYPIGAKTKAPAAVTRTDVEGRFAFDVPAKQVGYIALGSGDLVWKRKPPRFLGSEVDLNLGELTVHMGAVLRGRVISENDAPIEGVKLQFVSNEHFGAHRKTESDRNGGFELRGLPGGTAYMTITSQGYIRLHKPIEMELGKMRDGMVVRLRRGDAIMGIVVDDQSKPIEGATISANGRGRSVGDGSYEYSVGSTKTNKDGEFHVTGLGVGPYRVSATAKGHSSSSQSKVKLQNGPLRFKLIRNGSIVGRLVDERGSPIKDSRVYSTTKPPSAKPVARNVVSVNASFAVDFSVYGTFNGRSSNRGVKTDAAGKFTLANIKPGKIWLVGNGQHRQVVHGPLQIVAGQNLTDVELSAERGGVVVVHVEDPDGAPVANARVTLRAPKRGGQPVSTMVIRHIVGESVIAQQSRSQGASIHGKTDEDGNCELAGVDPGSYLVTATHGNWVASKPVDVKMLDQGRVEADVTMTAGGKIAVGVVDYRGKAVAEQSFRIYVAGADGGTDKNGKKRKPRSVKSGRTDATGRATLGPIVPGAYEIVLELTAGGSGMMIFWGYQRGSRGKEFGTRVPFRVTANQTAAVELTRPKLASLSGTVTDASGPIANAQLVLSPDKKDNNNNGIPNLAQLSSTMRVRSDADGGYAFEELQPGKYSIAVLRRKGEMRFMKKVEIRSVNDHHQDLYLSVGAVEVVVKLNDKPVEGVKLSLNPVRNTAADAVYRMVGTAGSISAATTNSRGIARFEGIPAGSRYTLGTRDKKYLQPKKEPFDVAAGSLAHRELLLREAATLVITLVGAPGSNKLGTTRLEVKAVGSGKAKSRWVQAGRPRTEVRAPGRYEVRAQRYVSRAKKRTRPQPPWSLTKIVEFRAGKLTKIEIIVP